MGIKVNFYWDGICQSTDCDDYSKMLPLKNMHARGISGIQKEFMQQQNGQCAVILDLHYAILEGLLSRRDLG